MEFYIADKCTLEFLEFVEFGPKFDISEFEKIKHLISHLYRMSNLGLAFRVWNVLGKTP